MTTVMLKRIGGPPGQTVLLPCAATVTSMPPADPLNPGLGTCAAGEVTARWLDGEVTAGWLDGEADCAAAVVPEPIGVGVPELEQPTSAATVAAPTNAATIVKGLFGIICVPFPGWRCPQVRQPNRLVRCAGQKHLVSGSASAVAVAISAPFLRFKSVSFPAHVSDVVEMHEWFVAGRPLGPCT
ncbi:hypothetical protein [Mycobacterium sp.]|uniref:hypothetical protein n=1 Tax=Mycobacterium sp. TaxID=1785 RepID=UPI0033407C98